MLRITLIEFPSKVPLDYKRLAYLRIGSGAK